MQAHGKTHELHTLCKTLLGKEKRKTRVHKLCEWICHHLPIRETSMCREGKFTAQLACRIQPGHCLISPSLAELFFSSKATFECTFFEREQGVLP